ncbi:MAG: DUF2905 domain-containing protein [Ignavibacteria bacterium]|nr:DUF2905 domain-containing protein [Ignavibacteria bacterium]
MMSDDMAAFFRLLYVLVLLVAILTTVFALTGRIPLLGKLPGDFFIALPQGSVYLPVSSTFLVSGILSAIAFFIVTRTNRKDP